MRQFNFQIPKKKVLSIHHNSAIRGLNTLVSASQIADNEMSEAVDIQLVEDGKVQCPRSGQAYYGLSSGSKVTGLFPYYKSDGTKKLLRMVGTTLQVLNTSTNAWDNVTGYTYSTGLDTNGVMAYDKLYLLNGTDPLTYFNGSTITSWTAIANPSAPTATRTGSGGSYTFSYKIEAVTATGHSNVSSAGSTTLNQATLDSSNYMTVSWAAVTNAIGYNVYGRKDGQWYFLKYLEGNSSTSYVDKGQDTPNEAITPDGTNNSAGPVGKYIQIYKDSLFIFGDPGNPSRLTYSGGGDKIEDFTAVNGGGFIDISKNDGQMGTGLYPFKNSLVVFKEDSVYQFSFSTSGAPSITQVTAAVGCVAPRSIVAVENDVFFASRRGIFTLGNEAGFAFDVLRTNELSAKVRSIYQSINSTRMQNISAVYATKSNANLIIFAYSDTGTAYNNKALVYDRERLAWYRWTNIQANCWANYVDTSGVTHVLYGDDNSGYVKEVLTGSSDFGSAIQGTFQLKADSFGEIDLYKILDDFSVVLRKPSGSVNLSIIKDGTETATTMNVSTISPSINFGHYVFNRFQFKTSSGTGISSADEEVLRTKRNIKIRDGRTFAARFTNGSSGASFTLLSYSATATPRSLKYRKSTDLVN